MANIIEVTFVGFAGDGAQQDRAGETIMINPSFIIGLNASATPAGTQIKVTNAERDIVVSQSMAEIAALINT